MHRLIFLSFVHDIFAGFLVSGTLKAVGKWSEPVKSWQDQQACPYSWLGQRILESNNVLHCPIIIHSVRFQENEYSLYIFVPYLQRETTFVTSFRLLSNEFLSGRKAFALKDNGLLLHVFPYRVDLLWQGRKIVLESCFPWKCPHFS